MRYLKPLGLLFLALAALMVFSGSAAATVFTSPAGTTYTGTIKMVNSGIISFHGQVNFACEKSTMEGKVESHGPVVTAGGKISSLTLTGCNQNVKVLKSGSLEVHSLGNGDATVTSSGVEIRVEFAAFECVFATKSTDIGYLVGASTGAGSAFIDIESSPLGRVGGSFLCGSSVQWTGQYKITTPTGLRVS